MSQHVVDESRSVLHIELELVILEVEDANLAHKRHAMPDSYASATVHTPPIVRLARCGTKPQPRFHTRRERDTRHLEVQRNGSGHTEVRKIAQTSGDDERNWTRGANACIH